MAHLTSDYYPGYVFLKNLKTQQESKQPDQKMGQRPDHTPRPGRHTDGEEVHETSAHVTCHQGCANENNKGKPLHADENS